MTDSETGYIYSILPYYGSITSENIIRSDLPVSTRIPLHLYQKLLDKIPEAQGYHMFTDRYYTRYFSRRINEIEIPLDWYYKS